MGAFQGELKDFAAQQLGAAAIRAAVERAGIKPEQVEELIERLRSLYQNRGFLSGLIIDETEGMPAASVYFRDPDNNLLEFITMLPDPPRPDLGVLSWSEWVRRTPPAA